MKEQNHFKNNMDNPFTHYKWAKALAKPDSSELKFLIDQSPKSFRARPKSEFITLTVLVYDSCLAVIGKSGYLRHWRSKCFLHLIG